MNLLHRFIVSLLLGASLLVPMVVKAASFRPAPGQEVRVQVRRYYDREHHDWHNWDEREAAAHRHWLLEERHVTVYREYPRTSRRERAEYWRWRHEHPDWH